jgi:hypothetical protein
MSNQLVTNRNESRESPMAHPGAPPDSECARHPPMPGTPYKPYSETPALPEPPYNPTPNSPWMSLLTSLQRHVVTELRANHSAAETSTMAD